jgi:anti-sigma regulatory factor (Ser/Thr protein kinase)
MTAGKATRSGSNGRRFDPAGSAVPHFDQRRAEPPGWTPVERRARGVVSRLHMQLKPGAQAAGEGRHALDPLGGAIEQSQLDTLRLLVTELVTNSVRHARAAAFIALDVEIDATAVRVAVSDRGRGFHPDESPRPHTNRPGGWGLCLVDRLSDRWGVSLGERTSVWFEMDRPGDSRLGLAHAS